MDEVIGYVDTRAAEVATTAIASDVAQVHQDMLDADADASAAAASAAAAAGTLANAVKKTGEASQNVEGDLNLTTGGLAVSGDAAVQGNFSVVGDCEVKTPVNNNDAANKKYVDDADALKMNITDVNTYAVGLTGNQTAGGIKTFTKPLESSPGGWHTCGVNTVSVNEYVAFAELKESAAGNYIELEFIQSSNTAILYGHAGIKNNSNATGLWFVRKAIATNNPLQENCLVIAKDSNGKQYLALKRVVQYGSLNARVMKSYTYGSINDTPSPQIEWLTTPINLGDGTGYTLTTVIE